MCSALGWVCVADAAGRRFLLPFFVLCSHHANVACTIPQKNSTLNDPLQSLLQSPSLATNFIEPLARTPARHNFNWCRHEKQLLHKLTRILLLPLSHSVYSCYLLPFPCCSITMSTLCCFLPTEAAQLPFGCQFACIFYLLVLNACTLCLPACVCQCVCQYVCVPVCVWVC